MFVWWWCFCIFIGKSNAIYKTAEHKAISKETAKKIGCENKFANAFNDMPLHSNSDGAIFTARILRLFSANLSDVIRSRQQNNSAKLRSQLMAYAEYIGLVKVIHVFNGNLKLQSSKHILITGMRPDVCHHDNIAQNKTTSITKGTIALLITKEISHSFHEAKFTILQSDGTRQKINDRQRKSRRQRFHMKRQGNWIIYYICYSLGTVYTLYFMHLLYKTYYFAQIIKL